MMEPISEVLQRIASSRNRRERGVDVYVVVDDHANDEEPVVATTSITEEMLARESNEGATKHVLHNGVMSAISKWRNKK